MEACLFVFFVTLCVSKYFLILFNIMCNTKQGVFLYIKFFHYYRLFLNADIFPCYVIMLSISILQQQLVQACFRGDADEVRALLYKKEDVTYLVRCIVIFFFVIVLLLKIYFYTCEIMSHFIEIVVN